MSFWDFLDDIFYAELGDPPGAIYGTSGDDYLRGGSESNYMLGYDGNDKMEGGGGNDYLDGGTGNNTLSFFNTNHGVNANLAFGSSSTYGAGPVDSDAFINFQNITGSFYADLLQGDEGVNVIDGVAGNDYISGWGGNDNLIGGFGNDVLVGGEGNDTLSGGFDNDTLYGGNGIDTADYSYAYQGMSVNLGTGSAQVNVYNAPVDTDYLNSIENITGSYYGDVLQGDDGANRIVGLSGDDYIAGAGGADFLSGGDGNDTIDGGAGADTIIGGTGVDTVSYYNATNSVGVNLSTGIGTLGDAFGDRYYEIENIQGSNSDSGDVLIGNGVGNIIWGNGGNDVINGNGGDDALYGGAGNDNIQGGDGIDFINGGEGANYLDGGAGIDTLDFAPGFGGVGPEGPGVTVDLAAHTASGLGVDGTQVFNFENVNGTAFDDTISGDAGNNIIHGGMNQDVLAGRAGADTLFGETGADRLNGGAGNDYLNGGEGRDILTGSTGNDTFVFSALTDTGTTATTRDTITDFVSGQDKIDLSGIDANANVTGDNAFSFIGNLAFSHIAGQLHTEASGANTILSGDVNGDGVADFQILLTGQQTLTAADFIL